MPAKLPFPEIAGLTPDSLPAPPRCHGGAGV